MTATHRAPSGRGSAALLLALLLGVGGVGVVGAWATPAAAQAPPPDGDWRTFRTEHFRVTHQAGLEPLARRAAAAAERTHAVLRQELADPPAGTIELVVTDHVDYSNGYATPWPSNRIVVYARPPLAMEGLAYTRDWIELVVAHELVHVFHFDQAGPVGDAIRAVFGRLPGPWPVFPVVGTATWSLEGLATHYESRLTGAGRVHGSFHDMVIRTAALESSIPSLREVDAPRPTWPGGHRAYVYGAAFMDWIAREHGPDAHARLIDATAGAVLPTFLFFDRVAREPLDAPFHTLYREWRRGAADSARAVAARVRDAGETVAEPVVARGPFAVAPRASPDGRLLAYSANDYRSSAATRLLDLETGRVRTLGRRNQIAGLLGPASWLPDGSGVVVPQLEYRGPYRLRSDLWELGLDGTERRLTRGERLTQPDVAPDGRRVAAVQAHGGGLRLVLHDRGTGRTRVLVDAAPGDGFDLPRWAPDGRHLAVSRFLDGRLDLVVVDTETGDIRPITRDDALDRAPAWTAGGRWVLFASDRTGIPNIFAAGVGPDGVPTGELRQVTNVVTGAFDPEPSADGRTLFFSAYHNDGWHIERTPLDPALWRPAPPPVMAYHEAVLDGDRPSDRDPDASVPHDAAPDAVAPDAARSDASVANGPGRAYSPWPSLRPHFWMPTYEGVGATVGKGLDFAGVYSAGWDVLQRHQWEAGVGVDVHTGRLNGDVAWSWNGLGNPVLTVDASRDWSASGLWIQRADGGTESVFRRLDRGGVSALFRRRRWRSSAWLRVAAETEVRRYEARDLDAAAVRALGVELPEGAATVGLWVGPGVSTADLYPFSISYENGFRASGGAGRWWAREGGALAYDELVGRVAGYLSLPLPGFANHVLAGRLAGVSRTGPDAPASGVGGVAGDALAAGTSIGGGSQASFLPVRGFDDDVRLGTRAWAASVEYRFPIHMPQAPPAGAPTTHGGSTPRGSAPDGGGAPRAGIFGLSLAAIHGAVFVDAGDAWCPDDFSDHPCTTGGPVASAGVELATTGGVLDNVLAQFRLGAAVRLRGAGTGRVVPYIAFGPSF